jgi:hypothetical protein
MRLPTPWTTRSADGPHFLPPTAGGGLRSAACASPRPLGASPTRLPGPPSWDRRGPAVRRLRGITSTGRQPHQTPRASFLGPPRTCSPPPARPHAHWAPTPSDPQSFSRDRPPAKPNQSQPPLPRKKCRPMSTDAVIPPAEKCRPLSTAIPHSRKLPTNPNRDRRAMSTITIIPVQAHEPTHQIPNQSQPAPPRRGPSRGRQPPSSSPTRPPNAQPWTVARSTNTIIPPASRSGAPAPPPPYPTTFARSARSLHNPITKPDSQTHANNTAYSPNQSQPTHRMSQTTLQTPPRSWVSHAARLVGRVVGGGASSSIVNSCELLNRPPFNPAPGSPVPLPLRTYGISVMRQTAATSRGRR